MELLTNLRHKKGCTEEAVAGMGDPGGTQRHCLSLQEWDKESQNPHGVASDEERGGLQEGFCRYISSKRKSKENLGLLLNVFWNPVTKDTKKFERYSVPSMPQVRLACRNPRPFRLEGKSGSRKPPSVEEDQDREHINKLDRHKCMDPNRMHTWELFGVTASHSSIFERSW